MQYLRFLGYKVNEMHFKINPDAQGEKNFKISPKIRIDMKQADKTLIFAVTVTIDKHQDTPTPFELTVNLVASFLVNQQADINTLRQEATVVVYPYVRSTVSNLTVNANIPAYFLPMLNFEPAAPQNRGESIIIRPLDENI